LIERFEALASDIVATSGGRVIKTIGDEVMFVADDVQTAAEIGTRLAEEVPGSAVGPGDDETIPPLRVGMAYGAVVARLGDVYGEPVNLASRLTSIARPGSVLVDREFADAISEHPGWQARRVPPRPVRGYAFLQPSRLHRVGGGARAAAPT
jgi:adenylate cyclase